MKADTKARYKHLHFDPYLACQGRNMYGFYARMSRYIFLCDYFFTKSVAPTRPPTETCIRVENNHFQGFGNDMCLFQKYMLVHEMTHFYLGKNGLGLNSRPPEVYSLDKSVGLSAALSLRNPQNYQALVASEFLILFFLWAALRWRRRQCLQGACGYDDLADWMGISRRSG